MNEDDPIYEVILNFLKDPKSDWGPIFIEYPLNRSTEIENDLLYTGDDACELILAFAERFNVDISDFEPMLYFSPEGVPSLTELVLRLLGIIKKRERLSFTIQKLVDAVEKGKLV